jgi:hypothetical protein
MSIKDKSLDFSDCSGGKNSVYPRHALAINQVSETINLIHEKIGLSRAPGYTGLDVAAMFTAPVRGAWNYIHDNGTETIIVVSNFHVYSIEPSTGAKTDLYTLSGDGVCWAVNAVGKLWIVNGTDFVKVENDLSVFVVMLPVPTGTSVAAKAGGSLAAGVYGCYVSYARKDADGYYLYSAPKSLGNVTLAATNLTVTFAVPASADAQVTHKVAWMTDAGGVAPIYYGEVSNGTLTFDITSSANRNGLLFMNNESASNVALPTHPDGIWIADNKLFVWKTGTKIVYWSLSTDVNPFNLERFPTENFRTLPYTISSIFSIDIDLFINSVGNGIIKIANSDMMGIAKRIVFDKWFKPLKTAQGRSYVVFEKSVPFGFTNDGIRYFNGLTFSDDLSFNVKPDIDVATAGANDEFIPSMIIFRRSGKRTELRFSFRDTSITSNMNNSQLIFNIDFFFDPNGSIRTWECWENGFTDYLILGNNIYMAQSVAVGGTIARESGVSDYNLYSNVGAFISGINLKRIYGRTRTHIDALDSITVWGAVYPLAISSSNISGSVIIIDALNFKVPFSFVGVSGAKNAILPADGAGGLEIPFVMMSQTPIGYCEPMPFACRGNTVSIEFEQIADDLDFFIYKIQLPRTKEIFSNVT